MSKEQSPAFQFYPKDFLSDPKTQRLSYEQVGWYICLLCYCWLDGSIPADPDECLEILGIRKRDLPDNTSESLHGHRSIAMAQLLAERFIAIAEPSRLYSKRLEEERRKQQLRREERSQSGLKGSKVRWNHKKRIVSKAIHQPIANDSSSSSISSSIASANTPLKIPPQGGIVDGRKKPAATPSALALELAEKLKTAIHERDPRAKAGNGRDTAGWARDIDLMIRIDRRTGPEIEEVIAWCQTPGCFWAPNILSGKKLRLKFDQMRGQIANEKPREVSYTEQTLKALYGKDWRSHQ